MVKYYGRARQRIGSVNTNQLGLKMSGCPSRVGRNPVNARYISQRVNCMNGTCGPVMIHGVPYYPNKFRNKFPYCKNRTSTCQAAAGGVGHINSPYYRTPAPGEKGCGCKFGPCEGIEGFALLAGAGSPELDEVVVGFIKSGLGSPPFGTLNLEDSSPIKKENIFMFFQQEKCSLVPPEALSGPACSIVTVLQLTPALLNWLNEKVAADGGDGDSGIPSFILNINGKKYKNTLIGDENNGASFFGFSPMTQQDTIEMQAGKTYFFNFS
ncbi:MAG: hypothetical protein V3W20_01925 [Candidatus Neomarinimicrobiota bacterium]